MPDVRGQDRTNGAISIMTSACMRSDSYIWIMKVKRFWEPFAWVYRGDRVFLESRGRKGGIQTARKMRLPILQLYTQPSVRSLNHHQPSI